MNSLPAIRNCVVDKVGVVDVICIDTPIGSTIIEIVIRDIDLVAVVKADSFGCCIVESVVCDCDIGTGSGCNTCLVTIDSRTVPYCDVFC